MVTSDLFSIFEMQDYLYCTTGGTCAAGTAYPFGVFEFIPDSSEVRVAQSLAFYVMFLDRFSSVCPFSVGLCIACPSSIYGF